ncbi:DUF1819 family protein [Pseudomonadales bacterium]|nr:DUF1819 family protein [Pseudomonadales bacterium]MDB9868050.1 DUF1819 family protein [Pseudomonadales bacterium]
MPDFAYKGDLSGGSLMVRESRVVATLLLSGVDAAAWSKAILDINVLQKRSPATAKRVASAIRRRLQKLPLELLKRLRDGDEELARQVTFCAVLARNLLLVEFIERVVSDAYVTHTEQLTHYNWSEFLEESGHRDPTINNWSESSRTKMRRVVFRILREMGYLDSAKHLRLQRVSTRPEIKTMLEDHHLHRIKDCLEVSMKGSAQ